MISTTGEIFRFATFDWQKIPKVRAVQITVGKEGRIYITHRNGKISMSVWDGESKASLAIPKIEGVKLPEIEVTVPLPKIESNISADFDSILENRPPVVTDTWLVKKLQN